LFGEGSLPCRLYFVERGICARSRCSARRTTGIANGPLTQEILIAAGFARATRRVQGMVGILRPGYEHFTTLSDVMFCHSPKMERDATFSTYEEEFYDFLLSNYLGARPRLD
jgi:hypothetical protein